MSIFGAATAEIDPDIRARMQIVCMSIPIDSKGVLSPNRGICPT